MKKAVILIIDDEGTTKTERAAEKGRLLRYCCQLYERKYEKKPKILVVPLSEKLRPFNLSKEQS